MRKLSSLLQVIGIDFDLDEHQILCFPHILNTSSHHITERYAAVQFTAIRQTWVNFYGAAIDKDAYITALRRDPVTLSRDIVRIVRASSLH
jgi:hypothetical protein